MSLRFGTDGLRGVANQDLTPELVLGLGKAVARVISDNVFLIGRDTRKSGSFLQAALSAGLASEGLDVIDVGVLPTPALAYLASVLHMPAAMISASHNQYFDNGIKLLSQAGMKLPDTVERAIEDELSRITLYGRTGTAESKPASENDFHNVGSISQDLFLKDRYVDYLTGLCAADADIVANSNLKIVCDFANGAAVSVGKNLFSRIGVEAEFIADEPDGYNINYKCGSTYLSNLAAKVVETKASFGLAFDGDADRVLAIDESGKDIDGDQLMVMFALDMQKRGILSPPGVAVTVMSNLGLHKSLREYGIEVISTQVGDKYVLDAIEANNLLIGGEQSGHIIFRNMATTGDGLLTSIMLISLLARTGESLGSLADKVMTKYPQVLINVPVSSPVSIDKSVACHEAIAEAKNTLGTDGRVLVRPSGTEPVVRVMVEAVTRTMADQVANNLVSVIEREFV